MRYFLFFCSIIIIILLFSRPIKVEALTTTNKITPTITQSVVYVSTHSTLLSVPTPTYIITKTAQALETNTIIIKFIMNNYVLILVIVLLLLPIMRPEWLGFWKFNNNLPERGRAKKMTLLRFFVHYVLASTFEEILVNGMAAFQFKPAITFIIFLVMSFDIFFRHQISKEAITLVSIGIIVLYLERLIEIGKHIKLFWGLLEWHKSEHTPPPSPDPLLPTPQTNQIPDLSLQQNGRSA